MHRLTGLPRKMGYSMPAEWSPHRATWMSWPFDEAIWHGALGEVRREYASFVEALSRFEPVHLLVRDEEARSSAELALGACRQLTLHDVPLDDVWLRDNGPIFITRPKGPAESINQPQLSAVNWEFNAWGQKYDWVKDNQAPLAIAKSLNLSMFDAPIVMEGGSIEVNGQGLCLTTEQCLLSPFRNPKLEKKEIESYLSDYLGLNKVIWLKLGLEGDHTDGHIDTITRFCRSDIIVSSVCIDRSDLNWERLEENLEILRSSASTRQFPYKIIELPLPENRLELSDGTRLPPTYANFYISNGAVFVPQYGDPQDPVAIEILKKVFPAHKVIGLSSRAIITGGGSFHCLTQQEPTAND